MCVRASSYFHPYFGAADSKSFILWRETWKVTNNLPLCECMVTKSGFRNSTVFKSDSLDFDALMFLRDLVTLELNLNFLNLQIDFAFYKFYLVIDLFSISLLLVILELILQILPPVPSVDVVLEPHHQALPVGVILSVSL